MKFHENWFVLSRENPSFCFFFFFTGQVFLTLVWELVIVGLQSNPAYLLSSYLRGGVWIEKTQVKTLKKKIETQYRIRRATR